MQAELDFFFLYKNTPHNSFFFLLFFETIMESLCPTLELTGQKHCNKQPFANTFKVLGESH